MNADVVVAAPPDPIDRVDAHLRALLLQADELGIDPVWTHAKQAVSEYTLRPAKRVRPLLVVAGYELASEAEAPESVWRFAAALELLHTFMLVHDDVADAAELRRGGPALHRTLARGDRKVGEDLAVVAGDHLFALAIEGMLGCGSRHAAAATQYMLGICRQTAAGQFLDIELSRTPIPELSLFQTLKVATLKTAKYGFSAPLVCGALLALGSGANEDLTGALDRLGQKVGLAFQLRDDLISLFGDSRVSGKPTDSDFAEGRRTFPVIAAWTRGNESRRQEIERLWAMPKGEKDARALEDARVVIEAAGGLAATQRVIDRLSRSARRIAQGLSVGPRGSRVLSHLEQLIQRLAHRAA